MLKSLVSVSVVVNCGMKFFDSPRKGFRDMVQYPHPGPRATVLK